MAPPTVTALAARVALPEAAATVTREQQPDDEPGPPTNRLHAVLGGHGSGALLPFQRLPDKRSFLAGTDSAIVYGRAGRVAVILGDPIGPPAEGAATIDAFVRACHQHGLIPVVYQASEHGRPLLEAAGFRVMPVGREAIVDLSAFGLEGSPRANLRHTMTRARRGGLRVEWHPNGLTPADIDRHGPALAEIDATWRRGAGPPMGFTISSFEPLRLSSLAIAIAFDPTGRPTAFATFAPTGRDGGWVLDLMRRLPAEVPGALESCIATAALAMRAEGATVLSLGLTPLAGLDRSSTRAEERILARAASLAEPFYDVDGLAFFKSKFDPRWEMRYAAVRRSRDLVALILGLLRLHLVPPGGSLRETASEAVLSLLTQRESHDPHRSSRARDR